MKVLVSEKLSEHKYKTPEGYLICTDAILARTGKQTYTKDELFGDSDDTEVDVDRPYNEVMNPKTIASFENKPVTFDHPSEDVNVGNYKDYAIGYVRDVHQGKTDKGEDVILGNLVITDQDAINAIEQGDHTDLSCGYDCDIKDDNKGAYMQTNIRGNHVALCEQGRAGIAHIVDSKVEDAAIGGHYKNNSGENFFVCSYGSGFSIFKADGEYLDGSKHLSLDGVKQRILSYNLTKIKDTDGSISIIFNKLYNSDYDSFDEVKRDFDRLKSSFSDTEKEKIYKEIALASGMTISSVRQKLGDSVTESNFVDSKLHTFSRLRDSYVIEELPEDETADIYVPILKKYNLKIQKLSGNKVKVIGNRNDIIRYYDKEIGIDEDEIGIEDSKVKDKFYTLSIKWDDRQDFARIAKMYNLKAYSNDTIEGSVNNIEEFIHNYCKESFDRDRLYDSKMDNGYTYKLTKKKNDYDEYVVQAYKDGKKYEGATYYTDDWEDAIGTIKMFAKLEKLNFRQQGSVYIADNKTNDIDSKQTTLDDALKILNIVKKVSK